MIQVGLIGCGNVAETVHLPCYQRLKHVKVVAVCDLNETKAKKLSKRFGIKKVYTDSVSLLEKEKLDLVDICTPGFTHHHECMKAINHGVNVLVEKPAALRLIHAEEIDEASERRGIKVCVVQDYRFKEPFVKATKMHQEGKIGQIKEVTGTQHGMSVYSLPPWIWDEQKSGGILYELGVHIVDLQTWFCGEHEKIIAVNKKFDEKLNYTTDIQAIIGFKDGALGILDLVWFSSAPIFHFNIHGTATDVYTRLFQEYFNVAAGSSSSPLTEFFIEARRVLKFTKNVLLRQMKKYETYSFMKLLTDYVAAIQQNNEPPVSISSVMNTMKLLEDLKSSKSNEENRT